MPHSPTDKRKALARVRRIRGQTEALERALEAGAECEAVLQQLAAIRGALNGLTAEVLASYLGEELAPADAAVGKGRARGEALANAQQARRIQGIASLVRTYLK